MANGQRFITIGRMPKESSVSLYLRQFKEETITSILFHHTQLTILLGQLLLLFLLRIYSLKSYKTANFLFCKATMLTLYSQVQPASHGAKEWLRKTSVTDKALSLISQLITLNVKVL